MKPLISVIIPAYNCARYLDGAIQSVINQSFKDIEIIVIDDGSTDNTADIIKPFTGHIKYYRQENKGAASARNHGIKLSSGKYIAFLDSDDLWEPHKLAAQLNILENQPDFPVVHTNASTIDQDGNMILKSANEKRQSHNGMIFEEFFLKNISVILTSSAIIDRKCLETTGLFDDAFPVLQDYDFFLRLSWSHPVFFIKEPLVKYRVRPYSLTRTNAMRNIHDSEKILEKTISEHPDFFKQHRKLLETKRRNLNFNSAKQLFYAGDLPASRLYFKKVLLSCPTAWLYYLRTFTRS